MREEQCLLTLMPGYFFAIVLHIVCRRCVIGLRHVNIFALRNFKKNHETSQKAFMEFRDYSWQFTTY